MNIQEIVPDDNPNNHANFARKMLENFMNYVLSYSVDHNSMMHHNSNVTHVPLSAVQNWYTNFERRLTQNPSFWKS